MAVTYIAVRGTDGTSGASSPETITMSGVGTGTRLLLIWNHGGGNGAVTGPDYVTPAGWTFVGSAYRHVNSGGVDWFASTVVYTKVAAADTSVQVAWTGGSFSGRSRGAVYEFSASEVAKVESFVGAPSPITGQQITDLGLDTSVFYAATAAGLASLGVNFTVDSLNDFTQLGTGSDTTFKLWRGYRDLVTGTIDLPELTNTQDGGSLYPWASVAVALSGQGLYPQAIFL